MRTLQTQGMGLGPLRQRAAADGADTDAVEDARDADDPKV
jgi:hypothetical protein